MEIIKCSVDECLKEVKQRGLCGMHDQRLRRTGRLNKIKGKYHSINNIKDTRRGYRGYLEANTIDDIRQKARQRKKSWTLTPEVAFSLITSECLYCGFLPEWPKSRVGIDRVDNSVGYQEDNCVSCCSTCNSAKGGKSLEDFVLWIDTIHSRVCKKT